MGVIEIDGVVAIAAGIVVLLNAYEKLVNIFGKNKQKERAEVKALHEEVSVLKKTCEAQGEEIHSHRIELKVLCKGMLACLKGLQEQGCNGPVTEGIKEMEKHLLDSAH